MVLFANSGDGCRDDGFELLTWDAGDGACCGINGALVGREIDDSLGSGADSAIADEFTTGGGKCLRLLIKEVALFVREPEFSPNALH